MEMAIDLIKGDNVGSEVDYRDYLPVNMIAIIRPIHNAQGYMLQHQGLTKYGDGFGRDRGGIWNRRIEDHYRVSGGSFISLDSNGIPTVLGSITGTETASLPYSFNTQGVITDNKFWLYNVSSGLVEITDPDLGDPIDGVWIDGYYFLTDGDFIYHTDIDDESSIDPLKFATAEFMPDKSLGVGKTPDNKAIVFGRETIEYFVNRANPNFAFSRVETRAIKSGIVGTHCKVEIKDKWYILGGSKDEAISVHVVGVGSVVQVASREVDKIIAGYAETDLVDVVLEARKEHAYSYLIVHLPNETLLLNITLMGKVGPEQAWSIIKSGVENEQWRAKHGVYEPRLGQWVYGDKIDKTIGTLDENVSTHYGELAEWVLNTPFIHLETLSIDELEIETIPGFTTTQDATVAISITYDGVTHSSEYWMDYGGPSKYGARFIAYMLGYVDDWFAIKLRGASRSRMAFSTAKLQVS